MSAVLFHQSLLTIVLRRQLHSLGIVVEVAEQNAVMGRPRSALGESKNYRSPNQICQGPIFMFLSLSLKIPMSFEAFGHAVCHGVIQSRQRLH